MKLLIYSNDREPVTQVLLRCREELSIHVLPIEVLLNDCQIYDEFDINSTIINWSIPSIGNITNSNNTLVINRVFELQQDCFCDFVVEDREYARAEFGAYLSFALQAFPKITEKPGVGSWSGGCYSLIHQWSVVEENCPKFRVPLFYVGPKGCIPKMFKKDGIFSSPYSFYNWKNTDLKKVKSDDVFVFKKPKGTPLLIFVSGTDCSIHNMDNSPVSINENMRDEIFQSCLHIGKIFGFFIFEVFIFLHEDEVTFGMTTNRPIGAAMTPHFTKQVTESIETLLNTWGDL
jgi:hypothetical protein